VTGWDRVNTFFLNAKACLARIGKIDLVGNFR